MINLPEKFKSRMKTLLAEDYDKFILSYQQNPARGVRINTTKISVEDFNVISPFKFSNTPFSENCKYFIGEERFGNHPYSHAGLFYMQEPAAMMPVCSIDIQPDWKVLDLCASPGGKSGQLANSLTNGLLISNEIVTNRSKILFSNMEKQGFKNVIVTNDTPQKFASVLPEFFDLVVVDAPCSGEGMFRKDPDSIKEWSEESVLACADRQQEILSSAKQCVAPGGYLIYSTCTFSVEENEGNVNKFLQQNPDFELISVNKKLQAITTDGIILDGNKNLKKCRRCYPHKTQGEGQFFALLQKNIAGNRLESKNKTLKPLPATQQKLVSDFLSKFTTIQNLNLRTINDNVYAIPDGTPELKNIRTVCSGVQIGTFIKNRFEPYHSLFTTFGNFFKNKVDLDYKSPELQKYLSGDTLFLDIPNGWGVITTNGFSIGGFKAVDGQLKNHYPKGLRK